jgi:uncharacterized membrane protein YciS (DUF1049 family)
MTKKTIIGIAVGIVAAWLVLGLCPFLVFNSDVGRGTFGDMFGAVNALFSGFALAGVVCAILLQREELQLQRAELELTRQELTRSAEAQMSAAQTLIKQQKLAKKNIRLAAYTALLQSKNDRISAERSRSSNSSLIRVREDASHNIIRLQGELQTLEQRVTLLVEDEVQDEDA